MCLSETDVYTGPAGDRSNLSIAVSRNLSLPVATNSTTFRLKCFQLPSASFRELIFLKGLACPSFPIISAPDCLFPRYFPFLLLEALLLSSSLIFVGLAVLRHSYFAEAESCQTIHNSNNAYRNIVHSGVP